MTMTIMVGIRYSIVLAPPYFYNLCGFYDYLYALNAQNLYVRPGGNDNILRGPGGPDLAVHLDLALGLGIVNGLDNQGGSADHPVGVGGGQLRLEVLAAQRFEQGQRQGGYPQKHPNLQPKPGPQGRGKQRGQRPHCKPD